jgi:tripartite-type tricarboxylate transporter receptor subunit TctC
METDRMHRRTALRTLTAAALAASGTRAWPAGFPERPVRLVVPFPAGGTGDAIARAVAKELAPRLGQPVVVDNKPGGSTLLATRAVLSAPPDGYTLLLNNTSLVQQPILRGDAGYQALRDFTPLAAACEVPVVLAVPAELALHTVTDFIAWVRAHPGRTSYASSGLGSTAHVIGEELKRRYALDSVHVPYQGDGGMLVDLLANRVQWTLGTPVLLGPQAAQGKLRLLAVTGTQRVPGLPQVPTFQQTGIEGFDVVGWFGFFAPARMAPAIAEQLGAELSAAMQATGYRQFLDVAMMAPGRERGAQFLASVKALDAYWRQLIAANAIRVE